MGAVKAFLKMEADKINAIQVSDLNKKNIGTLRAYAKSGKAPGQFIEVMACEGGCITGPSTHSGSNKLENCQESVSELPGNVCKTRQNDTP